ncbi:MAG TPA: YHS domain-containing protein [Rhodanobacteraceae bacterium]|jgi:YHS domain-containing protein
MPMQVPVFVIVLVVLAYVFAVALLLAYVTFFVAPRFRSDAGSGPAPGIERRAGALLSGQAFARLLPRPRPLDPVCGRKAPLHGLHSCAYNGRVYYFCSDDCRNSFARRPRAFLSETGEPLVRPQRSFVHFR